MTATADLAFQLRLPKVSLTETKNRLFEEIRWWNSWGMPKQTWVPEMELFQSLYRLKMVNLIL